MKKRRAAEQENKRAGSNLSGGSVNPLCERGQLDPGRPCKQWGLRWGRGRRHSQHNKSQSLHSMCSGTFLDRSPKGIGIATTSRAYVPIFPLLVLTLASWFRILKMFIARGQLTTIGTNSLILFSLSPLLIKY